MTDPIPVIVTPLYSHHRDGEPTQQKLLMHGGDEYQDLLLIKFDEEDNVEIEEIRTFDKNRVWDLSRLQMQALVHAWQRRLDERERWERQQAKEAAGQASEVQQAQTEAARTLTQGEIDNELANYVIGLRTFPDLVVKLRMSEAEVQTLIGQRVHTLSLPPRVAEKLTKEAAGQASGDGVINDWVDGQGDTEEARQVARDVVGWLMEDEVQP